MSKFLNFCMASVISLSALSIQTFAADITVDKSVYASNGKELSQAVGGSEWEDEKIVIDTNNVMQLYTADFYDYARTGEFNVAPSLFMGSQVYVADGIDESGNYAGMFRFVSGEKNSILSYRHTIDEKNSIDYEADSKRIKKVMADNNISSDCSTVKMLFVENIGYVYYIENEDGHFLAAAGFQEVNGEIFNDENCGFVKIDSALKAIADKELVELENYKKQLETLEPGENPVTDGEQKSYYIADNSAYNVENENPPTAGAENPNTGNTGAALILGTAIAASAIIFTANSKKIKK